LNYFNILFYTFDVELHLIKIIFLLMHTHARTHARTHTHKLKYCC